MQDLKDLKFQVEITGKRFVFSCINIPAAVNAYFIFGNGGLRDSGKGEHRPVRFPIIVAAHQRAMREV